MSDLIDALQRFDRKERNWLIRNTLGSGADALCPTFRSRLSRVIGKCDSAISVPPEAWWAIDFHIDWLVGALTIFAEGECAIGGAKPNTLGLVTGSQQDIDLLIAWGTTLLLIEAKGVGPWSGTGTKDKLKRLRDLPGSLFAGLQPYLVFTSPEPDGVPATGLPSWIKNAETPLYLPMIRPKAGLPLLKVQRCETGSDGIKPKAAKDIQWRILGAEKFGQKREVDGDC